MGCGHSKGRQDPAEVAYAVSPPAGRPNPLRKLNRSRSLPVVLNEAIADVTTMNSAVKHWKEEATTSKAEADAKVQRRSPKPLGARRPSFASSSSSLGSATPEVGKFLSLARLNSSVGKHAHRSRVAALYESGKRQYEEGSFEEALIDFQLCSDELRATARLWVVAKSHRNLDEYLRNCQLMIKRKEARAQLKTTSDKTADRPSADLTTHLGVASARPASSSSAPARDLLIFVCSPTVAPLPKGIDEASEVSQYMSAAICRGGTAADLQRQLLTPTRRFLFIGHADAQSRVPGEQDQRTLGFTDAGKVRMAANGDLAAMFGISSCLGGAGMLELVFLNGCRSDVLGREVHAAGVPNVVCWQTRTEV